MSVNTERAVRQLQRLLILDLEGNHTGPPEDFAASAKEDVLIATVTTRFKDGKPVSVEITRRPDEDIKKDFDSSHII